MFRNIKKKKNYYTYTVACRSILIVITYILLYVGKYASLRLNLFWL